VKILYFSPHPHINMAAPSGPGTHIREVIAGFEAHGHEVVKFIAGGETLHAAGREIQIKQRSWKKLIPKFVWQTARDYMLQRLDRHQEQQLLQMIEKEKPDVIYERCYYMMGAGYRAAVKSGVRYCVEMNAPYPEEKKAMNGASLYDGYAIRNERKQLNAAYKVFVVSTALKKYAEEKIGGSAKKVVVVPNAVNPAHVNTSEEKQAMLKQQLGISRQALVLGFVGSIFPYHGVDALIEVFAWLTANQSSPMHLVIVGDGEILSALKARTIELRLDSKVSFTGNVPHQEVYHYIGLMDITIMARSNWYGSPVKIFEYGIMQKCIVAPDVIPVRDVMIDGTDGILIPDSQEALRNALMQLIGDEALRNKMAASFHRKVASKHTWYKVSENILNEMQ
jgi:glycosyltransferase involved in cell wall biosynthesis